MLIDIVRIQFVNKPYDANMQNQQTYHTLWSGDEWEADNTFKYWPKSIRTEGMAGMLCI